MAVFNLTYPSALTVRRVSSAQMRAPGHYTTNGPERPYTYAIQSEIEHCQCGWVPTGCGIGVVASGRILIWGPETELWGPAGTVAGSRLARQLITGHAR